MEMGRELFVSACGINVHENNQKKHLQNYKTSLDQNYKCIKELLNDKDYHLKNADGAVAKRAALKCDTP